MLFISSGYMSLWQTNLWAWNSSKFRSFHWYEVLVWPSFILKTIIVQVGCTIKISTTVDLLRQILYLKCILN